MQQTQLKKMLEALKSGTIEIDDILEYLRGWPYEDLGFAKIDHQRAARTGFPEVIYGEGKTSVQITSIARKLAANDGFVLITRTSEPIFHVFKREFPNAIYLQEARLIVLNQPDLPKGKHPVAVLTAGTADLPVAEEAACTAEIFGCPVRRLYDVGVAGIHRLLDNLTVIREAAVIITIAGMDGVLPSVVAGLADAPVIGVPTSIGYGTNFQGIAPLLTMLNSCANGIAVVNIDNGFGAAVLAARIIKTRRDSPCK